MTPATGSATVADGDQGQIKIPVTPETLNLLYLERNLSNFLKGKKFNYVSDFARCEKLRTKTIVEGSKLRTKSDYNCRRK